MIIIIIIIIIIIGMIRRRIIIIIIIIIIHEVALLVHCFLVELEFGMLVFVGGGKPENPEKDYWGHGQEPTMNSTHMCRQNPSHSLGR